MGRKVSREVREYRGDKSSITFWLSPALKQQLADRAWQKRTTVTGLIVSLIEQDLASEQPTAAPAVSNQ